MTISDPLLNRKLNMFLQDFGLAMSFESNATRMRMRHQDQNVGAFMAFENDRQKKFFLGFDYDGRRVQGFSEIVRDYFTEFPRNLHASLIHELADWVESGTLAVLDGIRMRLNQLLSGTDADRYPSTYSAMESSVRFIRESESQRVYTALREILQRQEYANQDKPVKLPYDKALDWFKSRPFWVVAIFAGTGAVFLLNYFEKITKLFRFLFR